MQVNFKSHWAIGITVHIRSYSSHLDLVVLVGSIQMIKSSLALIYGLKLIARLFSVELKLALILVNEFTFHILILKVINQAGCLIVE